MKIPGFESERFVIAIDADGNRRKLFQVVFREKDGSLFVLFPYHKETHGILSLLKLDANQNFPHNISLLDEGKVTGHKVKYSHHPDGSAHFSQDGKIYTKIKKASVPLTRQEGHIFTIQLQGINDFMPLKISERKSIYTAKKAILNFRIQGEQPNSYKFSAFWYSQRKMNEIIHGEPKSPWIVCEKPDKTRLYAAILVNRYITSGMKYYLLLTYESLRAKDETRYSSLMFLGGFDRPEIALNHSVATTFLALGYPVLDSYEELVKKIGTVDFVSP